MADIVRMPNAAQLRAVKEAIAVRAERTDASPLQRRRALRDAIAELDAGRSAGAALALAYGQMPYPRGVAHSTPGDAA